MRWRAFLSAAAALAGAAALAAAPLTPEQQGWVARANRHEKAGWIYLHIEGPARERGFQYGYLLAPEIARAIAVRREVWHHESGMTWDWLVSRAARFMISRIDPEDLAELDGIAEGMAAAGHPTSRAELVAHNAFFELEWYWWPEQKKKLQSPSPNPPKQSCSSFIAVGSWTADHGVVLGHNSMVDYPEGDFDVILDIQPDHGHRILMQTAPGWIHSGTDFFVTDAGLVGSETTIGGFDGFDENGVPEFVRARRAMQDADTIEQWCRIMETGNNGGYANAWLLGDVRRGKIARLELGLKYVGFQETSDGYFAGSNVAEDLRIRRLETDEKASDIRTSPDARRVRWKELLAAYRGRIDLARAEAFEADHYDVYEGKEDPDTRTLCAHHENDPGRVGAAVPYEPGGTIDGKVVDSAMARKMAFAARYGAACGTAFDAATFLAAHPQFDWMKGLLKSRPSEPWVEFRAGETR